jgi:glycosyltransferase involved in cell wall biosynthesis
MINNFCVCTLTHNAEDRAAALRYTISSFLENYKGSKFEWFIVVNITNDDINKVLEDIVKKYDSIVQFNIKINDKNLGPGGGINMLNDMSRAYEYSLFIEGDWMMAPSWVTGENDWIQNSIKLLEKDKDISTIHYRRYLDDLDDRQYGFSYWLDPKNVEGVEHINGDSFVVLKKREYTNNPIMRRMSHLYDRGIFPLNDYLNEDGSSKEIKGNDEWGRAEILAMGKSNELGMKGAWFQYGLFVHVEDWKYKDNWSDYTADEFGCGVHGFKAHNRCKYGYLTPAHYFCGMCEKDLDLTDLERHSTLYVNEILPIEHGHVDGGDELVLKRIKELVKNPTINANEYIDFDTYRGTSYIRSKRKEKE